MLDLHLFQNPRFAVSSGGITLVFFAMFGSFFMLAQYLQGVLGWSPLSAAVRLLPFSLVMMVVAPQHAEAGRPVRRQRARMRSGSGCVARRAVRRLACSTSTPSYPQMLVTICVLAAGMALTMTPMTTQLMAAVPRDRAGMGSATNDTTRELGGALGVAVLGSLVTSKYTSGVAPAVAGLPADVQEIAEGEPRWRLRPDRAQPGAAGRCRRRLLDTAKSAFVNGLGLACTVGAVVVVVAAIVVYRYLPSDRRSEAITGIEADESVDPAAVVGD